MSSGKRAPSQNINAEIYVLHSDRLKDTTISETARTWNSLSFGLTSASSLSTFRRQLKTLFIRSYPDSFHRTWQTVFVLWRIPSFRSTLLGVLAVILTLRHLNQLFDEWMNEWILFFHAGGKRWKRSWQDYYPLPGRPHVRAAHNAWTKLS